jgi:hypothetical protein
VSRTRPWRATASLRFGPGLRPIVLARTAALTRPGLDRFVEHHNAPRSRAAHLSLRAEDGSLTLPSVHVNGQRGCGCGNPLKGWTPWQPYRKATA